MLNISKIKLVQQITFRKALQLVYSPFALKERYPVTIILVLMIITYLMSCIFGVNTGRGARFEAVTVVLLEDSSFLGCYVLLGEWFVTFSRHSDPSKHGDDSFSDTESHSRKSESLSTHAE
jgi:hypothetical protein